MNAADIISRATLVPFMVIGTYERASGDIDTVTEVVEAPMTRPPFPEDCIGAFNARRVVKASVFPATMFLDVEPRDRIAFAGAFRFYQLWSRARMVGKTIATVEPVVDYDPAYMAAEFEAWLRGVPVIPKEA